ncbi:MAG TPA: hypothetical protein PK336_02780 [Methanoculleus sp.]|nr:hypothetical protein [Methanoculleus sp.]HQP71944.1 hypothetical protein [Methanoculleus sp.]
MTPDELAALLIRCDPALGKVRARLLAAGGLGVVLEPDTSSFVCRLNAAGRLFSGEGAARIPVPMTAPALYRLCPGEFQIVAGYALSADGLWRRHLWGLRDAEVIETGPVRDRYFGCVLDPAEADRLCQLAPDTLFTVPLPDSIPAALHVERVHRALILGENVL